MKAEVGKITPVAGCLTIPDGEYKGVWGGYNVEFKVGSITYRATTNVGIRTTNAPCLVTVLDNFVTVETIRG